MDTVQLDALHPDFERVLSDSEIKLQFLYRDVRRTVLELHPDSNELLYFSHALSSVYSVSRQLKHAFCHIVVYRNHINLGFNNGTLLDDPAMLLQGAGARIRHVQIKSSTDLENPELVALLKQAITHAHELLGASQSDRKRLISKIKV